MSLAVRYGRQWRLTGLSGQAVLSRLAWTIQLTGRLLSGPVLSRQAILPLLAGLNCRIGRFGLTKPGLARRNSRCWNTTCRPRFCVEWSWRTKPWSRSITAAANRQRHRGEAHAAGAWPDGKAARALRQKAEPRAGAVVDLDAADPSVGVGIKLDRDVVRIAGGSALRHLDEAGGAANAERRRRRRDLHVAGFRHRGGDESGGALGDVEDRGVVLAAVLIDVIVDGDLACWP